MGPGTIVTIEALLVDIAKLPDALICSATDANGPGDRFADRHRSLARKFGVRSGGFGLPSKAAIGTKFFAVNRKQSTVSNDWLV